MLNTLWRWDGTGWLIEAVEGHDLSALEGGGGRWVHAHPAPVVVPDAVELGQWADAVRQMVCPGYKVGIVPSLVDDRKEVLGGVHVSGACLVGLLGSGRIPAQAPLKSLLHELFHARWREVRSTDLEVHGKAFREANRATGGHYPQKWLDGSAEAEAEAFARWGARYPGEGAYMGVLVPGEVLAVWQRLYKRDVRDTSFVADE